MKRKPISKLTKSDIDAIDDLNVIAGLIAQVAAEVADGMVKDSSITFTILVLLMARMAELTAVQDVTVAGLKQEVETLKKKVK